MRTQNLSPWSVRKVVRKILVMTIAILSLFWPDSTIASNTHDNVENFYSTFQVAKIVKLEHCGPAISSQKAQKNLYNKISISADAYKGLWGSLSTPSYTIWHDQPDQEEGVVEPQYIQRLFESNGEYWDPITVLTVRYPKSNDPYAYLEITDKDTLLMESGCWVYTLKRLNNDK